jgi:nucleoside-diphosphate-sugar epimerase
MKVIISGGSGFVGSNIIKDLRKKEVTIINISRQVTADDVITWEQFFKGTSHTDADSFIHLAGKAHDTRNSSDADEYFEVNTELTKQFFDVFLKSRASVFIYMSTVKAASDTIQGILTEGITPNPKTPYGQSKLKAEEYILNKVLPENKRVFVLRPCMVHGPGNKGNLNLLYNFVNKSIPYPFAAFENERSFLSIDNLSFVIRKLISDQSILSGIYNIADDEPLSTNKVIEMIAISSGLKPKLWKIDPVLIKKIALIGDKLHLPLNTERLKKLTESYVVSNEKIKKALKIANFPVSSTDGLIRTIKCFSLRKP